MSYQIVQIKPKGRAKTRFVLELEPELAEALELGAEVIAAAALRKGDTLSAEKVSELRREDESLRCRSKAWDLLALRPRSVRELEQALRQRRFSPATIEATLARLDELGHLDDEAYARLFVDQRVARRDKGPRLVRQELQQRGIAPAIIEEALSPAEDRPHQVQSARALLEKWNRRSKPDDPVKRKAAAASYLMRRGFEPEVVWEVIGEVAEE
ncbi:MAG: regulatory protein RecX [Sumerlaeia bacterium]